MNEQEKQSYLERYHEAKERGVPFFPDIIFKDVLASLLIFAILAALAYFVGVPTEARADPADTSYTPKPEWYFLFLFQLLKYFPGSLEVIGVMVIPTLGIVFLLALPFIDKSPKRYFLNRPFASLSATAVVVGIVVLTVLSVREAPPPQATAVGDQAAALYSKNCSNCHGPRIDVPAGTDLHELIARGKHEGMPAWGGDLSADEIDALAGFIVSPKGSALYTQQCGGCHELTVLAAGNPVELQRVLDEGPQYPPHQNIDVPNWSEALSTTERNSLLNFLAAPDGQRLFSINCAGCHGRGVAFAGDENELRTLTSKGGQHLAMPAWRGTLTEVDLDTLAAYVTDPATTPAGKTLFEQHCSACHGETVPAAPDKESARIIISSGGGHVTMPVWGDILTPEQLDALVAYTLSASKGTGAAAGAQLFADNCAGCHGLFGEGGPNPSRADDTIAPISSAEYLKTRDDITLRSVIAQGQPNFGMSPFGSAYGGPLSDDQMDAIVAFMREWEANPPVELPSEVSPGQAALTGAQIFADVCSRCHGPDGEGGIGLALGDPAFQDRYDDQALFDTISNGHEATSMIAWGEILTTDQIQQLVRFIRSLKPSGAETTGTPGAPPSFSEEVLPLMQAKCSACHSKSVKLGGWDSSSYETVMTTGDNGPVVTAGDPTSSLLAQKVLGTQAQGDIMPPGGLMPENEIQLIVDWIAAGAPEK
ncbi:MAG TPA: c-type cytochrome [Anaerolineales bacterium]|nr:c-type cytochrome [Anaerolineales bacterium]